MNQALRTYSVLFLTSLLMLRTLVVPMILIDFELHQDYIAKYLCENRSRPELHCDGQCYLAKKLKAAQEHDEREASSRLVQQLFELPAQIVPTELTFSPAVWSEVRSALPPYQVAATFTTVSACFHPPQV